MHSSGHLRQKRMHNETNKSVQLESRTTLIRDVSPILFSISIKLISGRANTVDKTEVVGFIDSSMKMVYPEAFSF